jgi:hypothetical protein
MGMNHDFRTFAVAHPRVGGRGDGRWAAEFAAAISLREAPAVRLGLRVGRRGGGTAAAAGGGRLREGNGLNYSGQRQPAAADRDPQNPNR